MSADEEYNNKVQEEIREILKLQYLIEAELDDINSMTKPGGSFNSAIKEGMESTEALANLLKVPLNSEVFQKFQQIKSNLKTVAMESEDISN